MSVGLAEKSQIALARIQERAQIKRNMNYLEWQSKQIKKFVAEFSKINIVVDNTPCIKPIYVDKPDKTANLTRWKIKKLN